MPGKNGTGPFGQGSMTGRGFGFCSGNAVQAKLRFGLGLRCRRGFHNLLNRQGSLFVRSNTNLSLQEKLIQQKDLLEKRLHEVNHDLERYQNNDKANADN